jgi:hypothetical protein
LIPLGLGVAARVSGYGSFRIFMIVELKKTKQNG